MSGVGARNKVWQKIIAGITGLKILIPGDLQKDLAVKGVTIIAGWGGGVLNSLEEGYKRPSSSFNQYILTDKRLVSIIKNLRNIDNFLKSIC